MKKLLIFALCLLLAAAGLPALAEEVAPEPEVFTSGDFEYALLDDGTVEITGYRGEAETLEVPGELDGHTVTAIGDMAFYWCSSLTSVTIPDSVTAIDDEAFSDCDGLTAVTIPDSVTSIGANPFSYCDNLTQITVSPDHPALATIDGVLFSKPDKRLVTYLVAFTDSEYAIPQGIEIIGAYAFSGCSVLTAVTIPDSVTSIGDWAFSGCDGLIAVTIPDSVTAIGDQAFYGCRSLTAVTIPDSVTSIGNYAFSWCDSLTAVTIPDSVTSIGDDAFSYCSGLTTVTIPDSVTSIGNDAFFGCFGLTEIIVGRDSYAKQYCIDNDLPYTYPDANDWLNS